MVMTNRDQVDRGMDHLASGLGPFVDQGMTAAFPAGKDWIKSLVARNPSRYGTGHRYSLSDPRFLLRVVTEEWRAFRDQLSRVEQGYATELKDAGNGWAHGEPFSADDTYRTLDTMERLLTAVGAAEQASQIRSLRLDLQRSVTGAATPSAGTGTPRPGQPPSGYVLPSRTQRIRHDQLLKSICSHGKLSGHLAEIVTACPAMLGVSADRWLSPAAIARLTEAGQGECAGHHHQTL
jgi:hypothetical protein